MTGVQTCALPIWTLESHWPYDGKVVNQIMLTSDGSHLLILHDRDKKCGVGGWRLPGGESLGELPIANCENVYYLIRLPNEPAGFATLERRPADRQLVWHTLPSGAVSRRVVLQGTNLPDQEPPTSSFYSGPEPPMFLISPDGSWAAGHLLRKGKEVQEASLWDLETGEVLLEGPRVQIKEGWGLLGPPMAAADVSMSRDGKIFMSVTRVIARDVKEISSAHRPQVRVFEVSRTQ